MEEIKCVICNCRRPDIECDRCEMYVNQYSFNWRCPHCLDVTEKILNGSRYKILGFNGPILEDYKLVETIPINLLKHKNSSFVFMQIMDDLLLEVHQSVYFEGAWMNRDVILNSYVKGNMFVLSYDTKVPNDVYDRNYHPTEKSYNGAIRCFWTIENDKIEFIWVHPDERNKGIGTKIIDICIRMGVRKNVICVKSSVGFWEKMGFTYKY